MDRSRQSIWRESITWGRRWLASHDGHYLAAQMRAHIERMEEELASPTSSIRVLQDADAGIASIIYLSEAA